MNFEKMSFLELLHELENENYKLGLNASNRFIDEDFEKTENKSLDYCLEIREELFKRYQRGQNKNAIK